MGILSSIYEPDHESDPNGLLADIYDPGEIEHEMDSHLIDMDYASFDYSGPFNRARVGYYLARVRHPDYFSMGRYNDVSDARMRRTVGGNGSRYLAPGSDDMRRLQLVDRDIRLLNKAIKFSDVVGANEMNMYLIKNGDISAAHLNLDQLNTTQRRLTQIALNNEPRVPGPAPFKPRVDEVRKRYRDDDDNDGSLMKRARLERFG